MYTKEELLELTNHANKKLQQQSQEQENDLYAEFRQEFEEIEKENIHVSDNRPFNDSEENTVDEPNVKLKYEMDDEEYEYANNLMQDSRILENEELAYPGGPTVSELDGWKKKYKGATIYAVKILNEMFTFRTLNRFEYKQLIRQANLDAPHREEIICETTVLHPFNYNWKSMAKKEAGIPSTLSQIIMQKSGFTDEYYIERL